MMHGSKFEITVAELQELMKTGGQECLGKIQQLGGSKQLCRKLNTSPKNGLGETKDELELRRQVFGVNVIPPKQAKSFLYLTWEAIRSNATYVPLVILQVATLISLALWFWAFYVRYTNNYEPPVEFVIDDEEDDASWYYGWIDSAAILAPVAVAVLVAALNDLLKERQFIRKLQSYVVKGEREHHFSIVRGGEICPVPISEIVVGDICQIKHGDIVPADGILMKSNDHLTIDESSIMGKSDLIKKSEFTDPLILSGTHVMEGIGKMVVTAVGINSQTGISFAKLGTATYEKSVLQAKLTKVAIKIGYAATIIAVLSVGTRCLRFSITTYIIQREAYIVKHLSTFVWFIVAGLKVWIIAIPRGLPLAVTLPLIYSARRMMKDNNFVRRLNTSETMGNVTTICVDKTGTLTTNRMTVVQSHICGILRKHTPRYNDLPPQIADLIVHAISVNTAYTSQILSPDKPGDVPLHEGNKIECALLGFVRDMGKDFKEIRQQNTQQSFTGVYTINAVRKFTCTVIPRPGGGYRMFAKGASEMIMNKFAYIIGANGKVERFSRGVQEKLVREVIEPMVISGLCTISLAYRDFVPHRTEENEVAVDGEPNWDDEDDIIKDLTCLCVLGVEDPLRPDVPEAIKKCQRAGITVRMLTGDNVNTARSIAQKCGIVKPGDDLGNQILEGKEFNQRIRDSEGNIQQDLIDKVWPRLRVLAQCSPQDKYTLVKGIIDSKASIHREVVAAAGDGINDGPLLKKADVGFSMGITGTDVAKEASDIILLGDNFYSIVQAVVWGRNAYDNIAKLIQFQLTFNVFAALLLFVAACILPFPSQGPLKAVQLLWVILIVCFASLTLATEQPTSDLLLRKPYGRKKPFITRTIMKNIFGQAVYQLIVVVCLLLVGPKVMDIDDGTQIVEPSAHMTMIFNTFVMMTLFNEINARKVNGERNVFKGICSNPIFVLIWVAVVVCQVVIVQFGGLAFSTCPLDITQWSWCVLFGVSVLIWGQLVTTIPTKLPKFLSSRREPEAQFV